MITVNASPSATIDEISRAEADRLTGYDPIRIAEIVSIYRFLEGRRHIFAGRVLDFGAGKPGTCREPEPYRALVEGQGAEYLPYDAGDRIPDGPFDVILCTQVLQYLDNPQTELDCFACWLRPRIGILVLTYPTNWAECEHTDLWRFTKAGVDRMLLRAGFTVLEHVRRAEVRIGGYTFPLGYGVVAVAGVK
jgi:SAM-dependent methyltransferase